MTKNKPDESCEISSDGGHVPGLHKIVVMSFQGKEQSPLHGDETTGIFRHLWEQKMELEK